MIEPVLYFLLGFLSSGLLALIIAPAIWSRAVRLTRRRIEASQPLTLAEIKADRDQLRADFAVTARRLELNVADLKAKTAAQRFVVGKAISDRDAAIAERHRFAAEMKVYESDVADRKAELEARQSDIQNLTRELDQRDQLIGGLHQRISDLNSDIDNRKLEIASLNTKLEAAGFEADRMADVQRQAETKISNLTFEIERRGAVITQQRNLADSLFSELATLKEANQTPTPQIARDDNERREISWLETANAALAAQLTELTAERDRLAQDLQAARVRDLITPPDAEDIAALKTTLRDITSQILHLSTDNQAARGPVDLFLANAPLAAVPNPATSVDDRQGGGTQSKQLDTLAEKIQALRAAAAGEKA